MAFRRRRYGKKRTYRKKKRTFKRRSYRKRTSTRSYSYKQQVNVDEYLSSTTTAVQREYTFRLSDLPQSGTFVALYDQYCISKVVCHFWPVQQLPSDSVSVNRGMRAYFVRDYDDAGTLTNINAYMEYQNCKVRSAGVKTTIVLRPRVSREIYRSATQTAYGASSGNQWIDCGYSDVPHYGVKVAIEGIPSGSTMAMGFRPIFVYYVKFRNVR